MTPDEAAQTLRERALLLIDALNQFSDTDYSTISPDFLGKWLCTILELYAEFTWNTAEIIEDLGLKHDFTLYQFDSDDNKKISLPTRERSTEKHNLNISAPPFDVDFFSRGDFNE